MPYPADGSYRRLIISPPAGILGPTEAEGDGRMALKQCVQQCLHYQGGECLIQSLNQVEYEAGDEDCPYYTERLPELAELTEFSGMGLR